MQRRESRFSPFFLSIRRKPLPAQAFHSPFPVTNGSSPGGSAMFTLLLTRIEVYADIKQRLYSPETDRLFR